MSGDTPFDAALAALDVEEVSDGYNHVRYPTILGLDAVRAAHRAEVERAVAEERDACLKSCRDVIGAIDHDGECPMLIVHAYEVHGAEKCIAEIRARGVAKPRTGSEAPSASDEGVKS